MNRNLELLIYNPRLFSARILTRIARKFRSMPCEPKFIAEVNGTGFEFDMSIDDCDMIQDMYYERFEIDMLIQLKRFLRPGDTFIDIGANIGFMSAYAAGCVGNSGEIHSFEPVRRYFNLLSMLPRLNPEKRFFLNNTALGNTTGSCDIHVARGNIGANSFYPDPEKQYEQETVQIRTFDDYASEKQLKNVKVIKIDCEGHECQVLNGMSSFFSQVSKKPVILLELSPSVYEEQGFSPAEPVRILKNSGYRAYDIKTLRPLKKAAIEKTRQQKDVMNVLFTSGE